MSQYTMPELANIVTNIADSTLRSIELLETKDQQYDAMLDAIRDFNMVLGNIVKQASQLERELGLPKIESIPNNGLFKGGI
jgi:hypothetical protein